jgi:hypothetical protein
MSELAALGPITIEKKTVWGNKRVVIGTMVLGDGSSTWPSGGLAITPEELGLDAIEFLLFETKEQAYWYDSDNAKIDAFVPAAVPGEAVIMTASIGAVPSANAVRFMAVGYGG